MFWDCALQSIQAEGRGVEYCNTAGTYFGYMDSIEYAHVYGTCVQI
jgi:hypothetical protein